MGDRQRRGDDALAAGQPAAGPGSVMTLQRKSTVHEVPADPLGEAIGEAVADMLSGATVELSYAPTGAPPSQHTADVGTATATGEGPPGWQLTVTARLNERVTRLIPFLSTQIAGRAA